MRRLVDVSDIEGSVRDGGVVLLFIGYDLAEAHHDAKVQDDVGPSLVR